MASLAILLATSLVARVAKAQDTSPPAASVLHTARSVAQLLATNAEDEKAKPDFRLITTGDTGGISSWRQVLQADRAVARWANDGGRSLSVPFVGFGGVTNGDVVLFRESGFGTSAAERFLAAPPFRREVIADKLVAIRSVHGLTLAARLSDATFDALVSDLDTLPLLEGARTTEVTLTAWRNKAGETVFGIENRGESATEALSTDIASWELLMMATQQVDNSAIVTLALPWAEGSRRLKMVRKAADEAAEREVPTLVLDAGNALDGYSFLTSTGLSLHRDNDWTALEAAGVTILNPSFAELLEAPAVVWKRCAGHGITPVSANVYSVGNKPEPLFERFALRELGDKLVAVTGVTDPSVRRRIPSAVAEGIEIREPASALAHLYDEIVAKAGRAPDYVVLLTTMPSDKVADLATERLGIDIVLGDWHVAHYANVETRVSPTATSRANEPRATRRPRLLHRGWGGAIVVADVTTGPESRTHLQARIVGPAKPRIDDWVERVMRVRHQVYDGTERAVIPNVAKLVKGDARLAKRVREVPPWSAAADVDKELATWPPRLTQELWQDLAANVLLDRFDGDVALLRQLPFRFEVPGPTRQLYLLSYLAVPDQVVIYNLPGDKVAALMSAVKASGAPITTAGFDDVNELVGGRALNPARWYRVVTTRELAARPALAPHMPDDEARALFSRDDWVWDHDTDGEHVQLADVVLDGINKVASDLEGHEDARVAKIWTDWMLPRGSELVPQWFFWIRDLSLSFSQYRNFGESSRFATVRETRATTADNLTLAVASDLSLIRESPTLGWETRLTATFGEIRLEDEINETSDDLVAQTELRLNQLNLTGLSQLPALPFVNMAYDTEFSAPDDAEEREQELRGTLGVTLRPPRYVTDLRLGLLAEFDLVNDADPVEYGAELATTAEIPLAPLVLRSQLRAVYFFEDDGDTPDDLGFTLNWRTAFGMPVVNRLAFELYADLFVFRGKVPLTEQFGASAIFGAQLHYDRLF